MNKLETGRQVVREMLGDDFLERRAATRTSFSATIQDYSDEVCFGTVWSRPGIDRKQRSIVTIASLVSLGRFTPLRTHVEAALNNGCTVEELREILVQVAVYAGLPAATEGFRIAEEVLRARNLLEDKE
jgi:4-carboxymuconolactone decarboxylase